MNFIILLRLLSIFFGNHTSNFENQFVGPTGIISSKSNTFVHSKNKHELIPGTKELHFILPVV